MRKVEYICDICGDIKKNPKPGEFSAFAFVIGQPPSLEQSSFSVHLKGVPSEGLDLSEIHICQECRKRWTVAEVCRDLLPNVEIRLRPPNERVMGGLMQEMQRMQALAAINEDERPDNWK